MGLAFDDGAIAEAHRITGGHPWLLRKLGSKIHEAFSDRAATKPVSLQDVEQIFAKAMRSFFAHVDWILKHLQNVAPDEHRLLHDLATRGSAVYEDLWADHEFREVFADHLVHYGLVKFDGNVPSVTIDLIIDAVKKPIAVDLKKQRAELMEAIDMLESSIRMRIREDLIGRMTSLEAVDAIVESIPREAKNRPSNREQLRVLGKTAGLKALTDALNWDDYLVVLEKYYDDIQWAGVAQPARDRIDELRKTTALAHVVRHNNESELEKTIAMNGFEKLYARFVNAIEYFTE